MAITHEERSHSAARPHTKCGRALVATQSRAEYSVRLLGHLTTQMPLRRGLPVRGWSCPAAARLPIRLIRCERHNVKVTGAEPDLSAERPVDRRVGGMRP